MKLNLSNSQLRGQVGMVLGMMFVCTLLSACGKIPNTPAELKVLIETPGFLLVIMYVGAILSALKTVSTAKRDGSAVTYAGYFARWETIAAAAIAVPIAWATLLFADQLNFAAAAAYGAVANTGLDLLPGSRSGSLATPK